MKYFLFIMTLVFSVYASSAEQNETDTKPSQEDQLRCERFIKSNLKELKSKLQSNCDLNKTFSTSLAINLGEEHYMYCCHKKK